MPTPDTDGPPSRADLKLWEQALRNDWPIPAAVKKRLLQVAINLADPADEEPIPAFPAVPIDTTVEPDGEKAKVPPPVESYILSQRVDITAKRDRVKLGALRVIAQFSRINLEQQKLDFARERLAAGRDTEATDSAGGLDPLRAENALRSLNDRSPTPPAPPAPQHPAGDP